jgi:hypothetical protein
MKLPRDVSGDELAKRLRFLVIKLADKPVAT